MDTQKNTTNQQQAQNTPWKGWRPGEPARAFVTAFCGNGKEQIIAEWYSSRFRTRKEVEQISTSIRVAYEKSRP